MAFFKGRLLNMSVIASIIMAVAYGLVKRMPESIHTFYTLQMAIALLGLTTVMLLAIAHHHRRWGILTNRQEDYLFLGSFTLFCISVFVAWRAYKQGGPGTDLHTMQHEWHERIFQPFASRTVGNGVERGWDKDHRPGQRVPQRAGVSTERPGGYEGFKWPCPTDAARCIVEEWYY